MTQLICMQMETESFSQSLKNSTISKKAIWPYQSLFETKGKLLVVNLCKNKKQELYYPKIHWHRENIPLPKGKTVEKEKMKTKARQKFSRPNIKSCSSVSSIWADGGEMWIPEILDGSTTMALQIMWSPSCMASFIPATFHTRWRSLHLWLPEHSTTCLSSFLQVHALLYQVLLS